MGIFLGAMRRFLRNRELFLGTSRGGFLSDREKKEEEKVSASIVPGDT